MPSSDPFLRPDWAVDARVGALMSTREGGVSVAPFDSLNLGRSVGDAPEAVAENRRRFEAAIGAPPVWLSQVHGVRVLRLPADEGPHEADACILTPPNQAARLRTALTKAPKANILTMKGGAPPTDPNPCEAHTPHGFLGIEKDTVQSIVAQMAALAAP